MQKVTRRQALVAIGAFAVLAGCSSTDDSKGNKKNADALAKNRQGAMAQYNVGDQFKATTPLTFTILYNNHPNYPLKKDWLFWTELNKRTNVTLNPVVVPLSDYEKKRSLLIGAGDAPMIIPKTYPGQEIPFVSSGAILPVSDYIDLLPNFKDKVAKWKLEPDIETLRQADGRFYLLPGLHEEIWLDYSLAIRTDILDKLGLEIPKTWDDVYTVLKAMKEEYPDKYPFSDRWSIPTPGGALFNFMAGAFGTRGGWGYANATWDANAQKFAFTGAMDQYKQMLTYLNKLISEKLMDPESFTQQDDQAIEKFASGKSFMISANAQELVNTYRPTMKKSLPKATIIKIPTPTGPAGDVKVGTRLENGIMISTKAADSPNFVAMMQFIDWLWYSDVGEVFAKWGVEGVTYTKDASGYHLTSDIDYVGLNPKGTKKLQGDYGFSNGVFAYGGTTELLQSTFSKEELEFQKVVNARRSLPVDPPYPLTDEEREQATLWESPLKDYVTSQTLNFVLGKRPLTEWDTYVKELEGKNMKQFIDLVNTAYQRYKQKHG